MNWKKFALVPMLATAVALGACGGDEEAEVGEGAVGEGVVGEGVVGEGVAGEGVVEGAAAPAFDPALDVNRDGILGDDEGLGDADGDGIRDRDEAYPAVD